LRVGTLEFVHTSEDAVGYVRDLDGERTLIVVNRGEAPAAVDLPIEIESGDILAGAASLAAGGRVTLGGGAAVVVAL
jgi:hypothetical protein